MREPRNGRRRKAPKNTEWRGNTLHGRVRIKGKLKRWSLRTGDVDIAGDQVKEDIARLVAAAYSTKSRVKWEDIVASWAELHIGHEVGFNTARRYATSLRQLEPYLLPLYVDEVDKEKINEIVDGRRAAGVSTATIRRDLSAVSNVLIYADVDENPALRKLAKLKERRDPIMLPEQEHIDRLIERAASRTWATSDIPAGPMDKIIQAAVATGCRQSELAFAERTKLDHGRRQLTVRGKGNKLRTIELDPFGGYEVIRKLPVFLGSKWLFWHGQGEPYRNLSSNFSHLVRAEFLDAYDAFHGTRTPRTGEKGKAALQALLALEKASLRHGDGATIDWPDIGFRTFDFHHLRHLHAVRWLKSGRSIYDLQERLAHESIKTTEIYLKFLTPEEKRVAKYGVNAPPAPVEQRRT
jgi:integrase/recombinase XerD